MTISVRPATSTQAARWGASCSPLHACWLVESDGVVRGVVMLDYTPAGANMFWMVDADWHVVTGAVRAIIAAMPEVQLRTIVASRDRDDCRAATTAGMALTHAGFDHCTYRSIPLALLSACDSPNDSIARPWAISSTLWASSSRPSIALE